MALDQRNSTDMSGILFNVIELCTNVGEKLI